MSRPDGAARQPHVGEGHASTTGTGGEAGGIGIAVLDAVLRDNRTTGARIHVV